MSRSLITDIVVATIALSVVSFVTRTLIRIIGLAILVAACVAGYYFYKHGHSNVTNQINQIIHHPNGTVSQLQKQINKYVNGGK